MNTVSSKQQLPQVKFEIRLKTDQRQGYFHTDNLVKDIYEVRTSGQVH